MGLITLAGKLISIVDSEISDKIIADTSLIGKIFEEFLFASFFKKDEEVKEVEMVQ